ncbi:hypothetical protein WKI71_34860 [Streptomyces sp. MS1.AVA.1]|uniref:Uncharacterized protein n=1 Tax=Streptomyces machairae TaxID=3134109 RepID=A0ABU8URY0_9ACTN
MASSHSFFRSPGRAGAGARDVGPEVGGLLLVGLQGHTVDRVEDETAFGAARGGRDGSGDGAVVRGDQRERPAVGVVVALTDQAGDVEEFLVDAAGGDRLDRARGVDVQVVAGPAGLREGRRAVLARQGYGPGAGDQDAVAGDEGDDGA